MKELPLTRGMIAFVDDEDFVKFGHLNWSACRTEPGRFYAYRSYGESKGLLHRQIMGGGAGVLVDHRDGNTLDCRRGNLRVTDHSGNSQNRRKSKNKSSSRFKGVCWDESRGLWLAYIKISRRFRNLGRFSDEGRAALAYDMAASREFGEFARLNFPT